MSNERHRILGAAIDGAADLLPEGLINYSDQQNVSELFKLAESVQDELEDQLNDLDEKEVLTEERSEQYNSLYQLSNELRVLINLHPERVLTWEDVRVGFI